METVQQNGGFTRFSTNNSALYLSVLFSYKKGRKIVAVTLDVIEEQCLTIISEKQ